MLERITDKFPRIKNHAGEGDAASSRANAGDESGASPDRQPSSDLFRCPSCGTVYIADSKETCRTCRTDVAEVR